MANNKFQEQIINNIEFFNLPSLKELNSNYLSRLSSVLGSELTEDETSNIYIMVNQHNLDLLNQGNQMLSVLQDMSSFFDYNRFNGYSNGTYDGMRAGLLDLGIFDDVKIHETNINATIQIVVLPKLEYVEQMDNFKVLIANQIHQHRAVGILTQKSDDAISQEVTASTGEVKTYSWSLGIRKVYDIKVNYSVDFEQQFTNYDFDSQIKDQINSIYENYYNSLGKDILIQDFFSLVNRIMGIKKVSITFITENPDEPEEPIEITDQDIAINQLEIFVIGNITTVKLAN